MDDNDDIQDLQSIRRSNMERFRHLQDQGISFENALISQLRVEAIIDIVCPQDSPEREAFEMAFERRMMSILEEAESQVVRGRLLQGVARNGQTPPLLHLG